MPFPADLRSEALVLAARHCCVCHRYKGLKVEAHHIIQEADGGPNTLDNAIVLCADCHTDAGHYNPRHPRGTKFSPQELRLARDTWQEIVKRGSIPDPGGSDQLYCRYLVCKDFVAIREIVGGNVSTFPTRDSMLAWSPAFDFLKTLVNGYGEQHRIPHVWGESIQSEEEYVGKHPDATKTAGKFAHGQDWIEYERTPSPEELQTKIAPEDFISRRLMEINFPVSEICRIRAFTDGCGDVLLQEEYRLRPLWGAFLVVTNETDRKVRMTSFVARVNEAAQPLPVGATNEALPTITRTVALPPAEILAGNPDAIRTSVLNVGKDVEILVLAELEDERTIVDVVSQGGMELARNVILENGDCLTLRVRDGFPIVLTGRYELLECPPTHAIKDHDRVRSLIQSFAAYLAENTQVNRPSVAL